MALTTGQAVAAVIVMALVTYLTRALPFLLFGRGGRPGRFRRGSGLVLRDGGGGGVGRRGLFRLLAAGEGKCEQKRREKGG